MYGFLEGPPQVGMWLGKVKFAALLGRDTMTHNDFGVWNLKIEETLVMGIVPGRQGLKVESGSLFGWAFPAQGNIFK